MYESCKRSHLLIAFSLRPMPARFARRHKRYRNKQYGLRYDFLGGRDEP